MENFYLSVQDQRASWGIYRHMYTLAARTPFIPTQPIIPVSSWYRPRIACPCINVLESHSPTSLLVARSEQINEHVF
jgi:hypothetical protein